MGGGGAEGTSVSSLLNIVWAKFHQGMSECGLMKRSHICMMLSPLQGPFQPMIFPSSPPTWGQVELLTPSALTYEKTEAQEGKVTCPRLHSGMVTFYLTT